jgi:hypothetical protein
MKKFDVIVMNPPFETRNKSEKKTRPLWQDFVKKSIDICAKNGHVVNVHPSGWRSVEGRFKETQNLLKSKQMMYLEMHHFKEGQDVFDAAIDYDWYVLKNTENDGLTKIKFQDESEDQIDISQYEFIPNGMFREIMQLVAKKDEEKVSMISESAYHTQRLNVMSKEKTATNPYPCVYTVNSSGIPTFWYSNYNKVHFGIPKVIWANGASGVMIDAKGEYGLTQFARAIVDDVENLAHIKKAMESERFIKNIMGFKHSLGDKYNRKIIATFRKDFWKEFIND